MLQPYRKPDKTNEAVISLAKKVTALLVTSAVTYKEDEDALSLAEDLLIGATRPILCADLQQLGSEEKP